MMDVCAGDRLRALRERADLSQTEVSSEVGLDQAVISRIETNKQQPKPEIQAAIEKAIMRLVTRKVVACTSLLEYQLASRC